MTTSPLVKAQLLAREVDVNLSVCFNPKELQVEKTAAWTQVTTSQDAPCEQFGPASPATLSVTLLFDTYEEKKSVYREYITQLEKLIHIIGAPRFRPPMCKFVWGNFCFSGVVESLSQKYTMFIADGMPVRCEVGLKMKRVGSVLSMSMT